MIANASCWITSQYNTANLVLLWQSDPMIDVESEFLPRHFLWTIIQFYSPCMSRSSLGLQSDITRQRYQPGDPHLSWHWIMLFYLYRFPDQDALYEQDKLSSYVDTVWAGCCLVQCRVWWLELETKVSEDTMLTLSLMTLASASQFHIYLPCLGACLA